ncbi:MAG TPA: hypothetical protein VHE60_01985 [Pyrinomonadaceae bacterium]|nr:hypothetical protein [Pyrinomonadaceae bacterium]
MKPATLLIILLLAAITFGQENHRRIGEIDFYGYAGLDLEKVRAALPLREGDDFRDSDSAFVETIDRIKAAITKVIGKPPTDIAVVCCDDQGGQMIYIGLPGKSMRRVPYNPPPKGTVRFPAGVIDLYQQTMEASSKAVRSGASKEDDSEGYSLSTDPELRAKQLATREYATHHERLVLSVLASSKDAEQRIAVAHILGYARQSKEQIGALVRASYDADETVRNNAIRALWVLAQSNPRVAARIPTEHFIAMLSSGSWTDRNKAGFLLDELSRRRNPRLLSRLRSQALDSLIEMARWRSRGHAGTARILLGRIAGIEETRLRQLVDAGGVEQILNALK